MEYYRNETHMDKHYAQPIPGKTFKCNPPIWNGKVKYVPFIEWNGILSWGKWFLLSDKVVLSDKGRIQIWILNMTSPFIDRCTYI